MFPELSDTEGWPPTNQFIMGNVCLGNVIHSLFFQDMPCQIVALPVLNSAHTTTMSKKDFAVRPSNGSTHKMITSPYISGMMLALQCSMFLSRKERNISTSHVSALNHPLKPHQIRSSHQIRLVVDSSARY